jgi:plastocyanin
MMRNGFVRLALVLGALLAAAITGCGGDDKVTNPPGPTLELNSGPLTNGQFYSHRFATAGTFNYECSLHPSQMTGTVTVSASAPAGDSMMAVSIPGLSFSPATVTVAVGGRVVWTSGDAARTHNVTSTN